MVRYGRKIIYNLDKGRKYRVGITQEHRLASPAKGHLTFLEKTSFYKVRC